MTVLVAVNYHCATAITAMFASARTGPDRALRTVVVDNSGDWCGPASEILRPGRNLGYLGGFRHAVRELGLAQGPDPVLLANPDIVFAPDFFARLDEDQPSPDTAILAPSIRNLPRGTGANPFLRRRPTSRGLAIRAAIHRNPTLLRAYLLAHRIRARLSSPGEPSRPGPIYAAHGSLVVFLPAYFRAGGQLDFPGFLFAEELYLAEEVRRIGLQVRYDPRLRADHRPHLTTSGLGIGHLSAHAGHSLSVIHSAYFGKAPT